MVGVLFLCVKNMSVFLSVVPVGASCGNGNRETTETEIFSVVPVVHQRGKRAKQGENLHLQQRNRAKT